MRSPTPSLTTVNDWRQLQRTMGAALFRPLTSDDDMQPAQADEFIKANDRMTAHERLEIYARQYWFRLLDCLYDDYPGLRALLGQRRFHALCRAYLAEHPSESWTLRNLGSKLEHFIQTHPQLAGPRAGSAIDIVRFEWAQVLAFDEAARKRLNMDQLLGASPDELQLRLQPHLSLIELDHAVDDFFMAVRAADAGMRSEASNALIEARPRAAIKRVRAPAKQKLCLVVHRCDNEIYFKRLDREAFVLLSRVRAGDTLSTAIESALADASPTEDWPAKLREWFQSWSALGWFCA